MKIELYESPDETELWVMVSSNQVEMLNTILNNVEGREMFKPYDPRTAKYGRPLLQTREEREESGYMFHECWTFQRRAEES